MTGTPGSVSLARTLLARRSALLIVGVGAFGVAVGLAAHRAVLLDDAAITFRYAARIADGRGWTYNDGDRTNGASAPLYTLVLAASTAIGFDLEHAAKGIAALAYGACLALTAAIADRVAGFVAALLAVGLLLTRSQFDLNALSGMESGLAAALGLATVLAVLAERDRLAGVLLGLALFTKLDAALLALALCAALLVFERRPPWRIMATGAAVVVPWLLFSLVYFGSPLPYSATQKLDFGPGVAGRWWVVDLVRLQGGTLLLLLAPIGAVVARGPARARAAVLVCVAWPLLHVAAFTVLAVDLAPWYTTVWYPPICIAVAVALGRLVDLAGRARLPAAVAVCLTLLAIYVDDAGGLLDTVRDGHTVAEYEAFEATRRDAGLWLHEHADPGDVIETCFGWIAYENLQSPIDETCPLSTRDPVGPPRWFVDTSYPGIQEPAHPGVLVATFESHVGVGGATYVYELPPPPDPEADHEP